MFPFGETVGMFRHTIIKLLVEDVLSAETAAVLSNPRKVLVVSALGNVFSSFFFFQGIVFDAEQSSAQLQ